MKKEIAVRIDMMRKEMRAAGIAAVIIPQTDPHQSEYISNHWQVRRWLSGFTGSAGSMVITQNEALLWTDSRYFIQAAAQLSDTDVVLMKDGLPGTPSIVDYLVGHLVKGDTVGIDGMLFSATETEALKKSLNAHGFKLDTNFDVVDKIWADRPALPTCKVFIHDVKYAGMNVTAKIARVMENVKAQLADAAFIAPLDEIAWVLNIRSNDVKYNPVTTAFLYLADKGSKLFVLEEKIDDATRAALAEAGVEIAPYSSVKDFLRSLPEDARVLVEPQRTSTTIVDLLGDRAVFGTSAVAVLKGCRNDVQIEGTRRAMERDGVALVKAFMEIERRVASPDEKFTELDVAEVLRKYRSQQPLYFDESFGTIAGYAGHGAIVHYEADEETNAVIEPNGLLLVDSGAQYLDGTTDITRTVALSEPTEQQMRDFTLVMKGHIALGTAIFPTETRGAQLDVLARQYLWKEGLSYLHGTGHGVGHFLNVHEGPQSIRLNNTPTPLMPGMVTSNEPGLYRENVHGIRCENLVLCVPAMTTEFGEFLKFETLTLFPFDRKLFMLDIMTEEEIEWVDNYHNEVYARLSPILNDEEREWLREKTKSLLILSE